MATIRAFLTGAIVGGGAMYFFDPQIGKRRRALLEDQLRRTSRETVEGLDAAWCDLSNRVQGTLAEPGVHAFTKWTPGTRLLAGAVGGLLMANCLARRNLSSMLWGTIGFGLASRALSCAGSSGSCRVGEMACEERAAQGSGAPEGDAGYFHPPGTREEHVWPTSSAAASNSPGQAGQFPPAV
jgi:hypothetical protein